jgi:hypothetical protein
MRGKLILIALFAVGLLTGCNGAVLAEQELAEKTSTAIVLPALPTQISPTASNVISATSLPTEAVPAENSTPPGVLLPTPSPLIPTPTLAPEDWKNFPVIPIVSQRVKEIYRQGILLGNNPQAFSKVGDCGSTPAWFLGDFDRGPKYYRLGEHTDLEGVIQEFQGSFDRTSLAAKSGYNASSIFTPLWADPQSCQANETPLACEYRTHRPVIALVMLGSNDVWHLDTFEPRMRELIEYSIANGVIPVLSTKADNLEKDESINQTITRLAVEYQIPLINYWRAVQELPDQGLQEDAVHITWAPNRFDDPQAMKAGWPVRNLVSLQTLDAIWRVIKDQSTPRP